MVDSEGVAGTCRRASALLEESGAFVLECDVGGIGRPDLMTVELLARLKLVAVRAGRTFRVRDATESVWGLLRLTGLDETFDIVV